MKTHADQDDDDLDVDRFLAQFSEMFDLSVITDLSEQKSFLAAVQ
jgi:hypothetical protein